MHDTQVNVKIKVREIEQAKRTSRCCAGCGYWKDVDDLYYGLCTCPKASENGVRTMGFHRNPIVPAFSLLFVSMNVL